MQGAQEAVVLALDIICDAVDRYKELCEGRYCGELSCARLYHQTLSVCMHFWFTAPGLT